jgi:hypothetical protein
MAIDKKEREVLDLEKRFWDAMKEKDGQTAAQMTDDGCIVVGAQGVSAVDSATMEKRTRRYGSSPTTLPSSRTT